MNEWNKLSMKDRAAYIKLGIDSGITDLATIRDTYNKYAEGGEKSTNNNESLKSKLSTAIMNLAWVGKLNPTAYANSELTRDGGVPLRTYLLDREELKKEFLKAGYIEGKEGDYGLVRKAVGNRDIPIYQREPDAANREDLEPIGNINSSYYPIKGELFHAGSFPTTLYYNYQNGKLYLKAWDLNDYSGNTGTAKNYKFLLNLGATLLDKIGSPTVVTSGFLEIPENVFLDNYDKLSPYLKNFYKSKGLEYDFLVDSYKDTPTPHLPEIVVTNKSKKYAEGGLKDNNINEDDTYFGLTADDWKDVGLGMIPVVGTYRDLLTFKEDPTLVNGLGLGISAATDIATLFGVGALAKGSRALYKAYKAKEAISTARLLAAKLAANTYRLTRLDRITDTATNKLVKSSIQSMLAKRQNADLAKQKADFANTLFLDYTKRGSADTIKQIASPLKVDTGVNILLNWWNTNL